MLRKTYAVVDLARIAHNIAELKKAAKTDVMAVVKANAYGHGMIQVAKTAVSCGVKWFAVATPDEAAEFRSALGEKVLLLSPADGEAVYEMVKGDISLCAFTIPQLEDIKKACRALYKRAFVHLKIDTGMNRIGAKTPEEIGRVLAYLKRNPELALEGVFTHFAKADYTDKSFTDAQYDRFLTAREQVLAAGFQPLFHAANSAATLDYPACHLDLCRLGIAMYGYAPSGETALHGRELLPALSLHTRISHIKELQAGEAVSYGAIYVAEKPETIATVPIGYADGYLRSFSGKARAFLNGRTVSVAGRVCMDQTMFCVTGTGAKIGDELVLLGDGYTANDLAELAGTISYEILTGISSRVPRVYIHG